MECSISAAEHSSWASLFLTHAKAMSAAWLAILVEWLWSPAARKPPEQAMAAFMRAFSDGMFLSFRAISLEEALVPAGRLVSLAVTWVGRGFRGRPTCA